MDARHRTDRSDQRLARREFFAWAGRRGVGLGVLGLSVPTLLAACTRDEPAAGGGSPTATATEAEEGTAIVGDVVDFALTSDEWGGAFGFVTFELHRGSVDGNDVYYIRTDASEQSFAEEEQLVFVPKISALAARDLTGDAYLLDGGPTVFSSEPGRDAYTPAHRVSRVRFTGDERSLGSVTEVEAAQREGAVEVERTDIVLNAMHVKWSTGELPSDTDRREYLGPGQLLEPPDTTAMRVTFKLHECYPGVRYIVTDTALGPMAEGMHVAHSPGLAGATGAGATGRTNVFMNGIEGPGPMGSQPSVFDSTAGDAAWSPYWDHMTYAWKDGREPRVLTDEEALHEARDAGELDEFPGTPDTEGETFVVNCPVRSSRPDTFEA